MATADELPTNSLSANGSAAGGSPNSDSADSTANGGRLPLKVVAVAMVFVALALVVAALIARTRAKEPDLLGGERRATAIVCGGLAFVALGCVWLRFAGPRLVRQIGLDGLATIAILSGLHFAVTRAAALADFVTAPLGQGAVVFNSIGDEGIPCLLVAVAITLVPKPGAAMLSLFTVFLLASLIGGGLTPTGVLFAVASGLVHEVALAVVGLTTGNALRKQRSRPSLEIILRMALAIGVANGLALYVQFAVYPLLYRLYMAPWYVAAVCILGIVYGAIGAALGTRLGYTLRQTAL